MRGTNRTAVKAMHHNAALCEEMTAMGHQLASGVTGLSEALSGFRFDQKTQMRMASKSVVQLSAVFV